MIHPGDLPNLMSPLSSLSDLGDAVFVVSVTYLGSFNYRWKFSKAALPVGGMGTAPAGLKVNDESGDSYAIDTDGTVVINYENSDEAGLDWSAEGDIHFGGWKKDLTVPASGVTV